MLLQRLMARRAAARLVPVDALGEGRWLVVLGAPVRPDGRPTPMLAARLAVAAAAWRRGAGHRVLLTGDDGRGRQDEIGPMRAALLEAGVAEADIVVDGASLRTLASLEHCARRGIDAPVLISQADHLWRALFLADALGLGALGLVAPEPEGAPASRRRASRAREALARGRAVLDGGVARLRRPSGPRPRRRS